MRGGISLSPELAAEETDLGQTTIYAALKDGSLPSQKVGRNRRILRDDLVAWVKRGGAPAEQETSAA